MADFGVYVHIPFCARRCDYCAFATWTDRHHLTEAYVAACEAEVAAAVAEGLPPATSVFFGGGTPSLLPGELMARLLEAIPRRPGAEVTIECNPDSVTAAQLAGYRAAGATRLSFGVQSMDPAVLAGLGRSHRPAAVRQAVAWTGEAGFATFNADLIFGGYGEDADSWRRTLDAVLSLDPSPPHVSAYALTVEPGTPLARDRQRHPDDDRQADRYAAADRVLRAAGLEWYEISNWARPGHECRHNLLYWSQGNYRGFGCAAHSHQDGRRWWNVRTPERYIEAVSAGRSPVAGEERLDGPARTLEALQLRLRTRAGVPATALAGSGPGSSWDPMGGLEGLVRPAGDHLVLTRKGRLLANEVSLRLAAG